MLHLTEWELVFFWSQIPFQLLLELCYAQLHFRKFCKEDGIWLNLLNGKIQKIDFKTWMKTTNSNLVLPISRKIFFCSFPSRPAIFTFIIVWLIGDRMYLRARTTTNVTTFTNFRKTINSYFFHSVWKLNQFNVSKVPISFSIKLNTARRKFCDGECE